MLAAAVWGMGGALSQGTPQRKPVGAGIQPRAGLACHLPYYREGTALITCCGLLVKKKFLPLLGLHMAQTLDSFWSVGGEN